MPPLTLNINRGHTEQVPSGKVSGHADFLFELVSILRDLRSHLQVAQLSHSANRISPSRGKNDKIPFIKKEPMPNVPYSMDATIGMRMVNICDPPNIYFIYITCTCMIDLNHNVVVEYFFHGKSGAEYSETS